MRTMPTNASTQQRMHIATMPQAPVSLAVGTRGASGSVISQMQMVYCNNVSKMQLWLSSLQNWITDTKLDGFGGGGLFTSTEKIHRNPNKRTWMEGTERPFLAPWSGIENNETLRVCGRRTAHSSRRDDRKPK